MVGMPWLSVSMILFKVDRLILSRFAIVLSVSVVFSVGRVVLFSQCISAHNLDRLMIYSFVNYLTFIFDYYSRTS